jgi:polyphosphate glucokinase
MQIFGVDIGGSGIKGAPVDLDRGELTEERRKVLTPHPATPDAVADGVKEVVGHFGWTGPVGITFPGVVTGGATIRTAANVDKAWIDTDDRRGTVLLLTFGTGIGSALFVEGELVPNTELGHLELNGHDAEKRASTKAKEDHELTWEQWAHRVQKYLAHVEMLFSPELFIIGGGVSRKADKFLPLIEGIKAEIVPAQLQNNAGIVGAAMRAAKSA